MTNKEAAKLLEAHNIWRRGGEGSGANPKDLGIAIDVAVSALMAESNAAQLYAQEASADWENPSQEQMKSDYMDAN